VHPLRQSSLLLIKRLGSADAGGIRNLHDSGNPANMRTPLATLAALLDRLGRYEPAARIAGFALSPLTSASVPEIATAMTTRRAHTTKSTRPEQN